jgi:formate dehydrogenase maturation protein FdhE
VSGANNNLTRFLNQEFFTMMLYTNLDQDILMVGARNILYKLSAEELRLTQTLQWHSLDQDRESCLVKGKNIIECQNYIKVLQQFKVKHAEEVLGVRVARFFLDTIYQSSGM